MNMLFQMPELTAVLYLFRSLLKEKVSLYCLLMTFVGIGHIRNINVMISKNEFLQIFK